MNASPFVVYNASAGSGKTYTLTKRYLGLLFSSNSYRSFREMLALTFTNKAVGEMKTRILDSLFDFSQPSVLENPPLMFSELVAETELTPKQLQQKSTILLQQLLHNYSFFEISTIDRFNHKIIKTFARDLKLAQNFEVELDVESLLAKAVTRVLDRAGQEKELTQFLLDFSLEKIDDEKSWNIIHDLIEIGKLLFQENDMGRMAELQTQPLSYFTQLKSKLRKEIVNLQTQLLQQASLTFENISQIGLDYEDFPRKTLPNHLIKIQQGEVSPKKLYANTLEKNLLDGKILKAKHPMEDDSGLEALIQGFFNLKEMIYQRAHLSAIYQNLVPLALVNTISQELKTLEEEENVVPIAALNRIIANEIKAQPIPFIYERLGERYRHYFIDEFQDTSAMQWENLIPLVSNSLVAVDSNGKTGTLFLVGDAKQAIYRWRGGKAEQLLELDEAKPEQFVVAPEIKTLSTNWRSTENIIAFNNGFFSYIAPLFVEPRYGNLFETSAQLTNPSSGGYVELCFLHSTKEIHETYAIEVEKTIAKVRQQGYGYADICILVRDNKKGALLADHLSAAEVPLISSDALLLENDATILFLINLLKAIHDSKNDLARFELLHFLAPKNEYLHDFIEKNIHKVHEFLKEAFDFTLDTMTPRPVYDILEQAVVHFELQDKSPAHLTFFMQVVFDHQQKNGPDVFSFLNYWEDKKASLAISAPEKADAVTLMTIHKSKGLEFPVVIFPYADTPIIDKRKKKKIWVSTSSKTKGLGLSEYLMSYSENMLHFDDASRAAYEKESSQIQLDAINVLYVALTRAEKALFVLSEIPRKNVGPEEANSYAELLFGYANSSALTTVDENRFALGTFGNNPESSKIENTLETVQYTFRSKNAPPFRISTKSGQLWNTPQQSALDTGTLLHEILSRIQYHNALENIFATMQDAGLFGTDDREALWKKVEATVHHPLLSKYFTEDFQVFNEKEILLHNGNSIRPDRIALSGMKASILEYKTGKHDTAHVAQIEGYAQALQSMGYTIENTILIYINEEVQPLFL